MRAVLFLLAMSAPSLAYLDPVTGNLLVQAFLAAVAALALGYHRVRLFFQRLFGKKDPEAEKSKAEGAKDRREETAASPSEEQTKEEQG